MANTYVLIASQTLASDAASITFSSIPQTYTDLKFVTSCRSSSTQTAIGGKVNFNGSGTSFLTTYIYGTGTTANATTGTTEFGSMPDASATANCFSNSESYIPNYTSSAYKSFSVHTAVEQNATAAYAYIFAGRWSNTAAITSITYSPAGAFNLVQYSTFYLYGIKNS